MHPPNTYILLFCLLTSFLSVIRATFNLTLPYQHPNPEAVVQEVQRRLNISIYRRQTQDITGSCLTGNPIDDCWKCDPNWANDRQRLADCSIGFGRFALGGKGGLYYIVTDSSDHDVVNPTPGTLRHAVLQTEPLWIIFASSMLINLKHELIVNSYKTIDGRGVNVDITGGGCITIQYVTNVIIHNVRVYGCKPSGNADIRSSPTHVGRRGLSDGDGISISGSRNVTFAFNHFGRGLIQRMPRCRHGYFHVVNNDFTEWKMYAIGGSANPTINSQGNRYIAPPDPNAKEVTKRVEANEKNWVGWNWRTEGDLMENGAFFVPSGEDDLNEMYAKATSIDVNQLSLLIKLTMNGMVDW
ncbi:probable pectate lyase 5 [Tanacetum coccineum]